MPIFDQGYQHWQGHLAGHAWRWLAITRHGVRAQLKGKGVRIVLAVAFMPAIGLAAFLIIWGLFEQNSSLITPMLSLFQGLPEEVRAGPKAFRGLFWTMAFHYFFNVEMFFAMLLILLVGPNLISQDLRYNAIPLYFSRPLRRIDYFAGKLGIIAFFVAAVSIAPAVLAYALGLAFSFDSNVLRDTGRILLASVAYGAVVVLSAGTLMLAISSLSRNSRMVGAFWIGFWIVSGVSSQTLTETVRKDWCQIVSYPNDLLRIREALLDTPSARTKLRELSQASQQAMLPRGPFRRKFVPARLGPPPPPGYDEDWNPTFPWQWSAGVLAGLLVLSVWTLTTRVKTLDRLK
jgi:ABC-2 type transport system permease protein